MPERNPSRVNWQGYQRDAAQFFETLDMRAEIEAKLVGARSRHDVDVAVTFTAYGVEHTWLVECKLRALESPQGGRPHVHWGR